MSTKLTCLPLLHSGKVGDVYGITSRLILLVRTDRVSALNDKFDNLIPDKGKVLNGLSKWWMVGPLRGIVPNHLTGLCIENFVSPEELHLVRGRAEVVKRLEPIKIEAVVRRNLDGTGYLAYQKSGEICGIKLPKGLKKGDELPENIFTPTIKSETDPHISFETMCELIGRELAERIRSVSLKLFSIAESYLYEKGIILADSKFEFGLDEFGKLTLMDEVFTPDSSRFWMRSAFENQGKIISLDKQKVRDWLQEQIDKGLAKPNTKHILPDWLVQTTSDDYKKIYTLITGVKFI